MIRKIRVGSRDSALAVKQTQLVIDALAHSHPELEIELVTMKTTGDLNLRPFEELNRTSTKNPKGLFTKELEQALLDGRIDLAVHSLKDMPKRVETLPILAFFKRGDPRDALGLAPGCAVEDKNLIIGCSSARRRVQLERLTPGCAVCPIRGNVLTRLKKLDEGQYEKYSALVLAAAGLIRLGLESRIHKIFSPEEIIPAAGQGILACQSLSDYDFLDSLNDPGSEDCAKCEMAFVERLDGGCTLPIAAHAEARGTELRLMGLYADESRGIYRRGILSGDRKDAMKLGEMLAARLQQEGE